MVRWVVTPTVVEVTSTSSISTCPFPVCAKVTSVDFSTNFAYTLTAALTGSISVKSNEAPVKEDEP